MISELTKEKRIANRCLIDKEYEARALVLEGMPFTLTIETGAICPLRCPFCPQTYDDFDLSREFLQYSDFKRIIDYFDDSLQHINLFNWGEPLLNGSIVEMIEYAASHEIETDIHSTLNFASTGLLENLVGSGLTRFTVSLDGASEETYQGYRKGGSFRVVYDHLRLLVDKQKELGNKHTNIIWKFLVFRHNQHEIEKAKGMADELGIAINFAYATAFGEYVSTLEEYNGTDFNKKYSRQYDPQCSQLWKSPTIHSNGDVLPCCQTYHSKYVLGNIFQQDFKDIWNGARYRHMRQVVTGKVASDPSLFCCRCFFMETPKIP